MELHPYRGITAAIATKHRKEQILAPLFAPIGISLQLAEVDTDLLGTFTGEIEREGSPKEVVIRKARLGMSQTELSYGLASEGSIGPDPLVPFLNSDIECLAWIDDELGIEIVEFHRELEIKAMTGVLAQIEDLDDFLAKADFPNHGLIIKSGDQIFKGITQRKELDEIIARSYGAEVTIENDLRAHFNPSRRANIAALGKKLTQRLNTLCKECNTPGFGVVGNIYGLECRGCKNFNDKAVRGKLLGCAKCDYKVEELLERKFVEPADCGYCNP